MITRAKGTAGKKKPAPKMKAVNVRIPVEWCDWLERRAATVPGLCISDVIRMILKAERDREEARDGTR